MDRTVEFVSRNKVVILFLIVFIASLFLRFFQLDSRNPFGWDQVDNVWVSKNMIVNHEFPLVGMVAKQNSGIFIGPAYYYLIAFFYWIFNVSKFLSYREGGIYERSKKVFKAIKEGKEIGFQEGVSESYLYYYYMRKSGKEVY